MDKHMVNHFEHETLIKKLHEQAAEHISSTEQSLFNAFCGMFLDQYPLDAWHNRPVVDLFHCIKGLWQMLAASSDDTPLQLYVFNPSIETHRWQCGRTVIAVLQKDRPFLVDSLRLELQKQNILIHTIKSTVLDVSREVSNKKNTSITALQPALSSDNKQDCEALIYAEISLQPCSKKREALAESLKTVFTIVEQVVNDYQPMLNSIEEVKNNIKGAFEEHNTPKAISQTHSFLTWLTQSHFSFLGFREFNLIANNKNSSDDPSHQLIELPEKRLGLFKEVCGDNASVYPCAANEAIMDFHEAEAPVSFSKSSTRSSVHRNVYPDYIVVKKYDNGNVVGEYRFLGLFTYSVFNISPFAIPIVDQKVQAIVDASQVDPQSHSGKNIRRIIENYPREELFQSPTALLTEHILSVAAINERHVVRLILREDPFGHFVNCLVYVPKDNYSTRVRQKIEAVIGKYIASDECDSTTYFSESILARAHIVFKTDKKMGDNLDIKQIENEIISLTQDWNDSFQTALIDRLGETQGITEANKYKEAFSSAYQEYNDPRGAANDTIMANSLRSDTDIAMHVYRTLGDDKQIMRFKVMRKNHMIELSDIIPILEHLGLRVIGEQPFILSPKNNTPVYVHEFELRYNLASEIDIEHVKSLFEAAFLAIWNKQADCDAFNKLVLGAQLNWREVALLRVYAAYMKQTGFSASPDYIASILAKNLPITRLLVALFHAYFSPNHDTSSCANNDLSDSQKHIDDLTKKLLTMLDNVSNLTEDTVLRRYIHLFDGTLRTNFYQTGGESNPHKDYICIKLHTAHIDDIPEPKPAYEIFVFSPTVEGVHLRGGKVARGGLRWSDRIEDYRTEVLGLVKAQQVKNAVIVPHGAKGGFVAKKTPEGLSRDAFVQYGIGCYKTFISALLDVTDNIVDNAITPPKNVVRRDGDDPYLVVAADKGTATFSDIANGISDQYSHWLGDAFASGGSQGYDHKGMGITAKGAWVSVQRHFREKGVDIQKTPFSVVGIGDMAGDVFGNGMLLSDKIELKAAFNHLHIFIDPTPDTQASFHERQRLFDLPRSSWEDYRSELISQGGGVFSRQAKTITLTPEMQKAFDISHNKLAPNDLINHLLKAPVDLIWNGGIGTYVKGSGQTHSQVGDKANDNLRVNGKELRCKVFGEGGNLGLSQLGRIEFALNGGACYTDFIDNAAGVDCSDHEVNIKILLDKLLADGDITQKQRNQLLFDMTDDVSSLVLKNNYRQTFALSLADFEGHLRLNEYRRFIQIFESEGKLNRALEFLPSDDEINERQSKGKALTLPELSVLISYAKVSLKEGLMSSSITDDPYIAKEIETAFPTLINEQYSKPLYEHKLLKEIVGMQVANDLINNLGITAAQRLKENTGESVEKIAKAYIISRDVFQLNAFQGYLKTLDNTVSSAFQAELMLKMSRRVRRGTRWFLRNRSLEQSIDSELSIFQAGLESIFTQSQHVVTGQAKTDWEARQEKYLNQGINQEWATRLAMPDNLFSGLCVVESAQSAHASHKDTTEIFYLLLDELNLNWFAAQISNIKTDSYWQTIAKEALIDDVEHQVRALIVAFLRLKENRTPRACLDIWLAAFTVQTTRWQKMMGEVRHANNIDFAMFTVALRELVDLANATTQCQKLPV